MKNDFQMADILININGLMLMVMFMSPWDVQIFVQFKVEQMYAELVKQVTIFSPWKSVDAWMWDKADYLTTRSALCFSTNLDLEIAHRIEINKQNLLTYVSDLVGRLLNTL